LFSPLSLILQCVFITGMFSLFSFVKKNLKDGFLSVIIYYYYYKVYRAVWYVWLYPRSWVTWLWNTPSDVVELKIMSDVSKNWFDNKIKANKDKIRNRWIANQARAWFCTKLGIDTGKVSYFELGMLIAACLVIARAILTTLRKSTDKKEGSGKYKDRVIQTFDTLAALAVIPLLVLDGKKAAFAIFSEVRRLSAWLWQLKFGFSFISKLFSDDDEKFHGGDMTKLLDKATDKVAKRIMNSDILEQCSIAGCKFKSTPDSEYCKIHMALQKRRDHCPVVNCTSEKASGSDYCEYHTDVVDPDSDVSEGASEYLTKLHCLGADASTLVYLREIFKKNMRLVTFSFIFIFAGVFAYAYYKGWFCEDDDIVSSEDDQRIANLVNEYQFPKPNYDAVDTLESKYQHCYSEESKLKQELDYDESLWRRLKAFFKPRYSLPCECGLTRTHNVCQIPCECGINGAHTKCWINPNKDRPEVVHVEIHNFEDSNANIKVVASESTSVTVPEQMNVWHEHSHILNVDCHPLDSLKDCQEARGKTKATKRLWMMYSGREDALIDFADTLRNKEQRSEAEENFLREYDEYNNDDNFNDGVPDDTIGGIAKLGRRAAREEVVLEQQAINNNVANVRAISSMTGKPFKSGYSWADASENASPEPVVAVQNGVRRLVVNGSDIQNVCKCGFKIPEGQVKNFLKSNLCNKCYNASKGLPWVDMCRIKDCKCDKPHTNVAMKKAIKELKNVKKEVQKSVKELTEDKKEAANAGTFQTAHYARLAPSLFTTSIWCESCSKQFYMNASMVKGRLFVPVHLFDPSECSHLKDKVKEPGYSFIVCYDTECVTVPCSTMCIESCYDMMSISMESIVQLFKKQLGVTIKPHSANAKPCAAGMTVQMICYKFPKNNIVEVAWGKPHITQGIVEHADTGKGVGVWRVKCTTDSGDCGGMYYDLQSGSAVLIHNTGNGILNAGTDFAVPAKTHGWNF